MILSVPFCIYHFVPYHFVQEPSTVRAFSEEVTGSVKSVKFKNYRTQEGQLIRSSTSPEIRTRKHTSPRHVSLSQDTCLQLLQAAYNVLFISILQNLFCWRRLTGEKKRAHTGTFSGLIIMRDVVSDVRRVGRVDPTQSERVLEDRRIRFLHVDGDGRHEEVEILCKVMDDKSLFESLVEIRHHPELQPRALEMRKALVTTGQDLPGDALFKLVPQ